jgi:PhoPQ-activated pathogenicity-related protein
VVVSGSGCWLDRLQRRSAMRTIIAGIAVVVMLIGCDVSVLGVETQFMTVQSIEIQLDGLLSPTK